MLKAVWYSLFHLPPRWRRLLQGCLIVGAVLFIYSPVFRGDWLWDDTTEITENDDLRNLSGLGRAWTNPSGYDYLPVKESLQWIEWQLWGNQPLGYHLATIAFHLGGVFCLWSLLRKLGFRFAWLAAFLFAIHPLAVESVAWISEQKNTTSLPLLLLSALAFLRYEETRSLRFYASSILLFAVSMLCKASGVSLPAILLLYIWWRQGRIRLSDLKTAAPFFLISLALGLVTIWFQQHRALGGEEIYLGDALTRCAAAGLAFSFYLGKAFWPFHLLPLYPRHHVNPPVWLHLLPLFGLCVAAVIMRSKRVIWGRDAAFALGTFALGLLPVLGFVPMSFMRYSWVADHFVYFPLISMTAFLAGAFGRVFLGATGLLRHSLIALAAVVLGGWSYSSREYAKNFRNSETLWSFTIEHNPAAWLPYNNLGHAQARAGLLASARKNFQEVVLRQPKLAAGYGNLGAVQLREGRLDEAVANLQRSIELAPQDAKMQANLGYALSAQGRGAEAIEHLQEAVRLDPRDNDARTQLADALAHAGRSGEAGNLYREVLQKKPESPEAMVGLADQLVQKGQLREAVPLYEKALLANPLSYEGHYNLGHALAGLDRSTEALAEFSQAARIKPNSAEAHFAVGSTLAQLDRTAEAIAPLREAVRVNPNYGEAQTNLANVLLLSGRVDEAITHYREALRINPQDTIARDNLRQAEMMQRQKAGK